MTGEREDVREHGEEREGVLRRSRVDRYINVAVANGGRACLSVCGKGGMYTPRALAPRVSEEVPSSLSMRPSLGLLFWDRQQQYGLRLRRRCEDFVHM